MSQEEGVVDESGRNSSSALGKNKSFFMPFKKQIVADIIADLGKHPRINPNYFVYWKRFFPNEPRMGNFKCYFDSWVNSIRLEKGLPKRGNSKKVPRSISTPFLYSGIKSKYSSLGGMEAEIRAGILAELKQDPNALPDPVRYWKRFFPKEAKMGCFARDFTLLVARVRYELPFLRRVKPKPRQAEEMWTLKGKKFTPMHFRRGFYSLTGLPVQIEAFMRDNPGKQIPTAPFARYLGVTKQRQEEAIRSALAKRAISLVEAEQKLERLNSRIKLVKIAKVCIAKKVEKQLGSRHKREKGYPNDIIHAGHKRRR
ncbi:MAG: hypothetical protein NTY48_04470 [Candidatus Diapherotrites archaeon]|nr:hypothetical protein [Candidatus Diapherotrites archaeon]